MNEKFETYLKKYCEMYEVSKEEALTHKIVLEVKEYYEKEKRQKCEN